MKQAKTILDLEEAIEEALQSLTIDEVSEVARLILQKQERASEDIFESKKHTIPEFIECPDTMEEERKKRINDFLKESVKNTLNS